jgi:hypothetical protein
MFGGGGVGEGGGVIFLKPDKTKKRKEKERCKRYKGGYFLKKWVQVDSS